MTERQEIFNRINDLMEDSVLSYEFKDASDLEAFLEDDENQQYEEYETIEQLYDELMELSEYEEE